LSCDSDAPQVGSARSDSTRVVKVNCPKTHCTTLKTQDILHMYSDAVVVSSTRNSVRVMIYLSNELWCVLLMQ